MASPGESRYRVVLEEQRGGALEAIRAALTRWKEVGVTAEPLEIGGIVGFPARLLDNRRALIVEEGFHAQRALAQDRADALAELLPLEDPPRVFADSVRRARGKVVVTEPHTGIRLIQDDLVTVQATDGGPITVRQVEFGRGYSHHGFEDRRYHGEIILAIDPTALLTVVNRLPAELMLRGIVPSETFPTAPKAALDAQAITARTELLAKLGVQNRAYPYLICATQRCQVYGGLNKETPMTNRAVERTRGVMLFGAEDHLVDSVYHACSGGYTENNENVWVGSPNPALRGLLDAPAGTRQPWPPGTVPNDDALRRFLTEPPPVYMASVRFANKVFRWVADIDDARMSSLIGARHPIGAVRDVEVVDRGAGRTHQDRSLRGRERRSRCVR